MEPPAGMTVQPGSQLTKRLAVPTRLSCLPLHVKLPDLQSLLIAI